MTSNHSHSVISSKYWLLEVVTRRLDSENWASWFFDFFWTQGRMRGPLAPACVLNQMSKYRASLPTYAHILLTTPQKHPWLASYQLWSRPEQAQAPKSRKTAQITFFHCQTHHCAVLPGPQSTSYACKTCLRKNDIKQFKQRKSPQNIADLKWQREDSIPRIEKVDFSIFFFTR